MPPNWLSIGIKYHIALFGALLAFAPCFAGAVGSVDSVRVLKSERKLQLLDGAKVLREYGISLGGNPEGRKQREGDHRTPEGRYTIDYKKTDSSFYKAIHISYPDEKDRAQAKKLGVSPGGQIMIHGQKNGMGWLAFISQRFDWTDGCIAVTNSDMDELWAAIKVGTPIEILP